MADDEQSGWQLTESDPGVFTHLLHSLGIPLIVDDLYSLDSDALAALAPIHALIFLFKYQSRAAASDSDATDGQPDPDFPGFFAHQTVQNACATLAALNATLNVPSLPPPHPSLTAFLQFTHQMPPSTLGLALASSTFLREAHNALSPPSAISLAELVGPEEREKEEAYHFVVYVPVEGRVYELDGLKEWAVAHGPYEQAGEGWLAKAREVVERRIATYPTGALDFSLLAIHPDTLPSLESQLASLPSSSPEATELLTRITLEKEKRERWAFETSLRRHNPLSLIHSLLLLMARTGTLQPAIEKAKTERRVRESVRAGGRAGKA